VQDFILDGTAVLQVVIIQNIPGVDVCLDLAPVIDGYETLALIPRPVTSFKCRDALNAIHVKGMTGCTESGVFLEMPGT
jgi:hypothetical protein